MAPLLHTIEKKGSFFRAASDVFETASPNIEDWTRERGMGAMFIPRCAGETSMSAPRKPYKNSESTRLLAAAARRQRLRSQYSQCSAQTMLPSRERRERKVETARYSPLSKQQTSFPRIQHKHACQHQDLHHVTSPLCPSWHHHRPDPPGKTSDSPDPIAADNIGRNESICRKAITPAPVSARSNLDTNSSSSCHDDTPSRIVSAHKRLMHLEIRKLARRSMLSSTDSSLNLKPSPATALSIPTNSLTSTLDKESMGMTSLTTEKLLEKARGLIQARRAKLLRLQEADGRRKLPALSAINTSPTVEGQLGEIEDAKKSRSSSTVDNRVDQCMKHQHFNGISSQDRDPAPTVPRVLTVLRGLDLEPALSSRSTAQGDSKVESTSSPVNDGQSRLQQAEGTSKQQADSVLPQNVSRRLDDNNDNHFVSKSPTIGRNSTLDHTMGLSLPSTLHDDLSMDGSSVQCSDGVSSDIDTSTIKSPNQKSGRSSLFSFGPVFGGKNKSRRGFGKSYTALVRTGSVNQSSTTASKTSGSSGQLGTTAVTSPKINADTAEGKPWKNIFLADSYLLCRKDKVARREWLRAKHPEPRAGEEIDGKVMEMVFFD